MFYNLEGIPMKALEARSDTEYGHTFSKYQFVIILETEVVFKTTFRASSH